LCRIQVIKKYYKRPSSSPTGCEKKEKRYGENENITEKRNGSILKRRATLYWILQRPTPVTFQLFRDTIEKIIKIFQE